MQFPDTPDGRLRLEEVRSAIEFGTRLQISNEELKTVTIEAPAGLGGVFHEGSVVAEPLRDPNWSLPGRLLLQGPDGITVGALPVVFNERTQGTKGFTVTASDRTGTFRMTQRIDPTSSQIEASFAFEVPADAHPGFVLPVLRFLHRMRAPNKMQIEVSGQLMAGGVTLDGRTLVPDEFLDLLEALDRVQAATASYFAIPQELTAQESEEILQADRLLQGDAVPFTWTKISVTLTAQKGIDVLLDEQPASHSWKTQHPDYVLRVGDHELHLGQFQTELDGAAVENVNELRTAPRLKPGARRVVTLIPAGDRNVGRIRLGPVA